MNLQDRLARFDQEMGMTPDMVADALPHLPDTPMPSPVHFALVNLMDQVLGMAKSAAHEGGGAFTALAVAMRTMQKMRGVALEELAKVPEEEVRAFLTQLARMIIDVVNAGHELTMGGASDTGADQPPAQGEGAPGGGDAGREVHAL